MLNINVVTTNIRGFLINLFDEPSRKIHFIYEKNNLYEITGKKREILARLIKLKIFDYIGLFRIVNAMDLDGDAGFSYNRFLKTTKPYIILLENPSALVNYCWERPQYRITKKKLDKCFRDSNLKAIVCMSKACKNNIDNLYEIPPNVKVHQIYPMIPDDHSFTASNVLEKVHKDRLECIFISSDFYLKGGSDILEVFKKITNEQFQIHLTIITQTSKVKSDDLNYINNSSNITIVEFNLSKKELNQYYKRTAIFLNPTRADSFSLVTLEAIKYGCAVIATDVYAIKEMDRDGYNGYIHEPMYKVWDDDGTMNKYCRKHPKRTIQSGKIDTRLVEWMYSKLIYLEKNRNLLETFCLNSLNLSRSKEFSQKEIIKKWEKIYCED